MAIRNCIFHPAFQNPCEFVVGNERAGLGTSWRDHPRPIVVWSQRSDKTMTNYIDLPPFLMHDHIFISPINCDQNGSRHKPIRYG